MTTWLIGEMVVVGEAVVDTMVVDAREDLVIDVTRTWLIVPVERGRRPRGGRY